MPFESLDFVYTPSSDVARDLAHLTGALGGEPVFAIEAFGTRVAMVRLSDDGPRRAARGPPRGRGAGARLPGGRHRRGAGGTGAARRRDRGPVRDPARPVCGARAAGQPADRALPAAPVPRRTSGLGGGWTSASATRPSVPGGSARGALRRVCGAFLRRHLADLQRALVDLLLDVSKLLRALRGVSFLLRRHVALPLLARSSPKCKYPFEPTITRSASLTRRLPRAKARAPTLGAHPLDRNTKSPQSP